MLTSDVPLCQRAPSPLVRPLLLWGPLRNLGPQAPARSRSPRLPPPSPQPSPSGRGGKTPLRLPLPSRRTALSLAAGYAKVSCGGDCREGARRQAHGHPQGAPPTRESRKGLSGGEGRRKGRVATRPYGKEAAIPRPTPPRRARAPARALPQARGARPCSRT